MTAFYQWIQSGHNLLLDDLFIALSFLGSAPVYISLLALIFWNLDKRFGFRLAVVFLFSMALNSWLKLLFKAPRPIGHEGVRSLYLSSAVGSSFPSGHSQGAATFYSYLWQRYPQTGWKILGIFMIVSIGFSRLYLGVHWPWDVLFGWGLGLLIVWGFQRIDTSLMRFPFPLYVKLLLSILLPLLALAIYPNEEGYQLCGFVLGFTSGYFLEDRFLDYRERTSFRPSLYKTALGLGTLCAYLFLLKPLVLVWVQLTFPGYALAGLFTSWGAPYLFRRFGWEG